MALDENVWRQCGSCKTGIPFAATHWTCSVSTCNRKPLSLAFCSVSCWEAHLPAMRHREAFAVEAQAPTREEWAQSERDEDDDPGPARRVVAATPAPAGATTLTDDDLPQDVLVVVSKLKKYIKARSGMNTSDGVVDVLSDRLRRMCDGAIRNAGRDGRKTVMARDFESLD
jgi:hypothetical protein